ncbi:MAG: uroporphyrinogen-III synthase [Betaproteobacteria bacterium]|nr:uroporphyrinogen-III synthase [Betaproteobacteria bacterium]
MAALAGRHVAVTRPAHQAGELVRAIVALGGEAVPFPVLEIADIADPAALRAVAARLDDYHLAVFVSANAVRKALGHILPQRSWPARLCVATVGGGSARELERHGIAGVIAPQGRSDSEALLDLPELAAAEVAGKSVLIFRGDGGRELLGDTLAARGARVDYVECYRRRRPAGDGSALLRLWARGQLDAITVTSSEGLRNLVDMAGSRGRAMLQDTPLFVPHARIGEQARALGLRRVVLTAAGDEGLAQGLAHYFAAVTGKGS